MIKPLSELLGGFVRQYGLEQAMLRQRMPEYWQDVVGKRPAELSTVHSFENGVLTVQVQSASWRAELHLRREEIRTKLNACIGTEAIRELHVK